MNLELLLFSLAKITWGLLVHPYQTMQSLLRERSFIWMSALPSLVLVIAKTVWGLVLVPTVQLVFSCHTTPIFACQLIPFFANWLTFFCLFWQLMLVYLLLRFVRAFGLVH